MLRWLAGKGASPDKVSQILDGLSAEVWQVALGDLPFLSGLSPLENEALRQRTAWVLASKTFSGAQGLLMTDSIRLAIAVQAALPVMHLDTVVYEGWTEIIVYPSGFLIPRVEIDDAGVVHEYVQEASGEAWEGGPVVLSWEDSQPDPDSTVNVVIHEFAHKLDLHSGDAHGMPGLSAHPDISPYHWMSELEAALSHFQRAVYAAEEAIPDTIDPDSDEAEVWFEHLPFDPYAATDPAEFFAVSAEAFFVAPTGLADWYPGWYALLSTYFRQDPVARLRGAS